MSRLLTRAATPVIEAGVATRVGAPTIHPLAWWGWAITAAGAVSMTSNPLLIALMLTSVIIVVLLRRSDAPWARSLKIYATLGAFIVVMRIILQMLLGSVRSGVVLFTLPEIALPQWAAGIRLGGPVTLDGIAFAFYEALRLAAMLMCVGAANSLANPKRALKATPAALHEVSTALVIAISLAPQLVESLLRVRRARRFRGGAGGGWLATPALIMPVLEDSIEGSMSLAAGMEARGYGATRDSRRVGAATTLMMVASMVLLTFATFLLLGMPSATVQIPAYLCLLAGAVLAVTGLRSSGRRLAVTRYRADPWTWRAWITLLSGSAAFAVAIWLDRIDWQVMRPASTPLTWPGTHPLMLVIAALLALPLLVTQSPPPGES